MQTGFAKLSILSLYRQVFCNITAKREFVNFSTIIVITAEILWIITFSIYNILQCGFHLNRNWEAGANIIAQCFYVFTGNQIWAGSDFSLDLIIFLMPIPVVRSLLELRIIQRRPS